MKLVTKLDLAEVFEQIAATLRASDTQDRNRGGEPAADDIRNSSESELQGTSAPGARSWIQIRQPDGGSDLWSSGERWYARFEVWQTDDAGPRMQFGLGYTPPEAGESFGQPRGYWIVHEIVNQRLGTEIAVFVEADNPADLVAVIRGNGPNGRSMFDSGEELPGGYENLTVDVFRDHVVGPQAYGKLAVVAANGDRQAMLKHAAIQSAR